MPVLLWGVGAIAMGIGAALPIFAFGKAADDTADAANKAAPLIIAGVAIGAYLLLRKK